MSILNGARRAWLRQSLLLVRSRFLSQWYPQLSVRCENRKYFCLFWGERWDCDAVLKNHRYSAVQGVAIYSTARLSDGCRDNSGSSENIHMRFARTARTCGGLCLWFSVWFSKILEYLLLEILPDLLNCVCARHFRYNHHHGDIKYSHASE